MAMIVTGFNHSSYSCPSPHPLPQNVIPQQLLDQYLSMTDPARAQTVDTEIAKHCAFSLPGVALTLGQQNWHCLKDTYETLATDVQVCAFWGHSHIFILGYTGGALTWVVFIKHQNGLKQEGYNLLFNKKRSFSFSVFSCMP